MTPAQRTGVSRHPVLSKDLLCVGPNSRKRSCKRVVRHFIFGDLDNNAKVIVAS